MIDLISNNPFRLLGVFINTSKKEIISNKGKVTAFARIGKTIPMDTDFPGFLPSITRSVENITEAESKLALPNDILRYSLFWFCNKTMLDSSAFSYIRNCNREAALNTWNSAKSISSLQNRLVYHLCKEDYIQAFACAEELYTNHAKDFLEEIIMSSELMACTSEDLIHIFCDTIYQAKVIDNTGWIKIDNVLESNTFRTYLKQIRSATYIKSINEIIDRYDCGSEPVENLENAKNIKAKSAAAVKGLQKVYDKSNPIYQTTMDKLSNAILSKAIAYYNKTSDSDCAVKALPLMEYASTLAVGDQQKNRCNTNTKTVRTTAESYNNKTVTISNSSVSINTTQNDVLKSFLMPLLKIGGVLLGDTSRSYAQFIGYNSILLDNGDTYAAKIKGVNAFDLYGKGKFDNFSFKFSEIDNDIKQLIPFTIKKAYIDWRLFFEDKGFVVQEKEKPNIYKHTSFDFYFCAKFQAVSYSLNLIIDLEFFSKTNRSYASLFENVDIWAIHVMTIIDSPKPYISWFEGNCQQDSCKSVGVIGEKTIKQLIYSPLGDERLNSSTVSFQEIKTWIKRNGRYEENSFSTEWCYFYDVPTTYHRHKINCLSVKFDSLKKLYIIEFDIRYYSGNIFGLNDVIRFCETMVSEINLLGFNMNSIRKYDEYLKFESNGQLGKVSLELTLNEYGSSCQVELWIKHNII